MKYHFEKLKLLKSLIEENTYENVTNYEKIYNSNNKLLFMELLVHMSDISNPLKPQELSLNWAYRCVSEFMIQGDLEKQNNLPILKDLFDRDIVNFNKSQVGFIEYVCIPLYDTLVYVFDDIYRDNVNNNLKNFKSNIEEDQNKSKKDLIPNYNLPDIFKKYRIDENKMEEDER